MTFADPIEDEDIQYRGVLIPLELPVGGCWDAPRLSTIIVEFPRDSVCEERDLRWLPHHEDIEAFSIRRTPGVQQPSVHQIPLLLEPKKSASRIRVSKHWGPPPPSRMWVERHPGATKPQDSFREAFLYNPTIEKPHLRFKRDKGIGFVPMERGSQIIAKLRKMGLTRAATGHWVGGKGRLRELRFFSLAQFPEILKLQTDLQ